MSTLLGDEKNDKLSSVIWMERVGVLFSIFKKLEFGSIS